MSEQQIPNVSDDAVTGLGHDPVQGATISEHDPVETVDHPHNTSDDTAGEPSSDDGHVDGQVGDGVEHDHPGTGEPSDGVEVPVGQEGTLDVQGSGQEPSEPDEGTGAPADGSQAVTDAPASAEGTVDGGNPGNPPTE